MSRIGKKTIVLPAQVSLEIDQESKLIAVKGPLGELSAKIATCVKVKVEDGTVEVSVNNPENDYERAIWGTTRAVLSNLTEGVSKGFTKEIELNGVGYKMELSDKLVLYIGYSHTVTVEIPNSIKLSLNKNLLTGTSSDKELLGNFFSNLYHMKPCDVYKHKGFKFPGKFYRKKVGKKGK